MNHPVPQYFSQWGNLACNEVVVARGGDPASVHDWRADGYATVEEYRYWSARTCGIACLQSVLSLDPDRRPARPKAELVAAAAGQGAFDGWRTAPHPA